LVNQIEEGYGKNNQPLYITGDGQATPAKESVFRIISEEDFITLQDSAVQEILRRQHIVVTEMRHHEQSFEKALQEVAPLDTVTSIHGNYCCYSALRECIEIGIDMQYPADSCLRVRTGKVDDILQASKSAYPIMLNALAFPNPLAGIERSSFSSDSHALSRVFRQDGWMKRAIPIEDVRWGLAATAGAFHHWHIDSEGFGTFVEPMAGAKWWIVARPMKDLNFQPFNETSVLLDPKFDLYKGGKGLYDVEAILLRPSSRL
jgi:hypothetical protein